MADNNEKVPSLRDKLRAQYDKIPYDPDIDPYDLNDALADALSINSLLRVNFETPEDWGTEDFEETAEEFGNLGFSYWEYCIIMETYTKEAWDSLGEAFQKKVYEKYFRPHELRDKDSFIPEFDIHPFRVTKNGIEKYYKYEQKDGKEVEGWDLLSITPIIIHSIGECLDDDSYMYKIKYKTITGKEYIKWVTPEVLLSSTVKDLVNLGLQFIDSDNKNLKLYFKQLLSHASLIPFDYTSLKNGWKKDNTILITGSYAHSARGKEEILALTEEIANAYEIKGSKKQWIETLTPLLEYDLIRLKCYAVVTAMVLRFLPVKSFIVHNYYESSGLKSISMQVAGSMVGNPLELIRDANSTKVGIEKSLEFCTDTPIFYDETSNNRDFQDVIYMIGNETGKGRGNKDGTLEKSAHWKTVVQTTGEMPLTKGQSTNTGQQIRVLEIYEGIPRLESDYIEKVKDTLDNNFGLFQDEIIQAIFEIKDKLKLLYKNLNMFFEKSQTVFADRSKSYFVALAVGGFILEDVFQKNNISTKDPMDLCNKYYKRIVLEDRTIPYYLRALDTVYSWHLRNKRLFEYAKEIDPENNYTFTKGPVELLGWITKEAIYYDPDKLQEYLTSKGFNFERVIDDWKTNEILEPTYDKETNRYKTWKKNTVINNQRVKGVKIPFTRLQEVLDIRDENIYEIRNNKEGVEEIYYPLIESCSKFLNENPELKLITHSVEEVTNLFIKSEDREELLIYGLENIKQTFEKLKKQK